MHYPILPREGFNQSPRLRRPSSLWHEVRDVTRDGGVSNHELARMVHNTRMGGVAVVASDTGYALVADPFNACVRAFIDTVRHDPGATYPLVFGTMSMLTDYAEVSASVSGIVRNLTPGPVTPVLDIRADLPERGRIASMLRSPGTIAARLPDSTLETPLSNELRRPLTTAALRHEDGSIVTDYEDVRALLAARLLEIENVPPLTLVRGVVRYREHSTMVRVVDKPFAESVLTILREGPVDRNRIVEASRDVWFDIDTT